MTLPPPRAVPAVEPADGSAAPFDPVAGFDLVAAAYDRQVSLNPGYHANLRRAAEALLDASPRPTDGRLALLDVGCGSGASTKALALACLRRGTEYRLLGVDGSAGMLAAARAKRWPAGVRFAQGWAGALTGIAAVDDGAPFDAILAAYLVRNVPEAERDAALCELVALLRPDGVLAVHEYLVRGNPVAAAVWTLVSWGIVVPLGWLTARHTRLYRYLWRSVLRFDSVDTLRARLHAAGLVDLQVVPATGWHRGILHTVVGRRPE